MNRQPGSGKSVIIATWVVGFIVLLLLGAGGLKLLGLSGKIEDYVGNIHRKMEILSHMRIDLLKSVQAEKSAVLADTDEASEFLAEEARRASLAVDQDRFALGQIVDSEKIPEEQRMLGEFDNCWVEFRKVDEVLLKFAVENTNLKAAHLSFVKGAEVVKNFEDELSRIAEPEQPEVVRAQVARLVSQAMIEALKIHQLHAPHIAAAEDERMDRIEEAIKVADEQVKDVLNNLSSLVGLRNRPFLAGAKAAYANFEEVTANVIKLSRENSNIKSMELSLGKKRLIAAQCDEILSALQDVVRSRTFKATR